MAWCDLGINILTWFSPVNFALYFILIIYLITQIRPINTSWDGIYEMLDWLHVVLSLVNTSLLCESNQMLKIASESLQKYHWSISILHVYSILYESCAHNKTIWVAGLDVAFICAMRDFGIIMNLFECRNFINVRYILIVKWMNNDSS